MESQDRQIAVVGCVLALGCLVPVALYQTGVLDHLPDPPGKMWNSERITSSKTAHPFGVPDSLPGLASYGTTLALLLVAPRSVTARRLLGFKLMGDAALAAFNVVRQVTKFQRLCSWCTGTALFTAASVYGGRYAIGEGIRTAQDLLTNGAAD